MPAMWHGTPEWSVVGGLPFFPLLSQGAVFSVLLSLCLVSILMGRFQCQVFIAGG